jgi:protocatechuate 3,4-dioxygenase beta subunit
LGRDARQRSRRAKRDGRYRLEDLSPWQASRGIGLSNSYVDIRADGFAPLCFVVTDWLRASRPRGDVEANLVLVRGATILGRAEDAETGEPLAGARVVAWADVGVRWRGRGASLEDPSNCRPLGEATSDADGRFRLEHLPALGLYALPDDSPGQWDWPMGMFSVCAPDHAPALAEVHSAPDGATLESIVRCWPAATIHGRVLDADGEPVAGACVWRDGGDHPPGWLPPSFGGDAEWTAAHTDGEGRYSVRVAADHRPDGASIVLRARLQGLDACAPDAPGTLRVSARAGETIEAPDLVLDSLVRLIVRDAEGRPVSAAIASLAARGIVPRFAGVSDAKGAVRFQLDGPTEALPRLVVSAPRHAPAFLGACVVGTPPLEVELQPAHRVAGRVIYADGSPAAGAVVHVGNAALPANEGLGFYDEAQTFTKEGLAASYGRAIAAEDGSFEIGDLQDGPFVVGACADAWDVHSATVVPAAADAADVVITLDGPPPSELYTVEGTVTDRDTGSPVQAVLVHLVRGSRRIEASPIAPGRFRAERVPPGQWGVWMRASSYPSWSATVDVPGNDGTVRPLSFVVDRGTIVRGSVRGAPGLDVREAAIFFRRAGDASPDARIDEPHALVLAGGAYEVSGLFPGKYVPVVMTARGDSLPVALVTDPPVVLEVPPHATERTLDVTVTTSSRLLVTVRSPRLPAIDDAAHATREQWDTKNHSLVEVFDAHGGLAARSQPGSSGEAIEFALLPATYTVRASIRGAEPVSTTVRLGDSRTSVDVEVP